MALSESLFQGNENALPVFLEKFWEMESDFERLNQRLDSITGDITGIEMDASGIQSDISSIEYVVGDIAKKIN